MIKDSKEEYTEEDLTPNESMICKRCDKSDFEKGKPHNRGKSPHETCNKWLRLFMCKNCKIESAL